MLFHPNADQVIRNYIIKNILYSALIFAVGIIAALITDISGAFIIGPLSVVFFLFDSFSVYQDYKAGKLSTVDAVIVSAEDGKTLTRRTITTYRAIPLDENGMYCNKNGKYDFFLEVDTTKRRLGRVLLIGATYRFVFRTTDDERDYSSKTLLTKQRGAVGLNIAPQKES